MPLRIHHPEDGIGMVFLTMITAEERIYWGNCLMLGEIEGGGEGTTEDEMVGWHH